MMSQHPLPVARKESPVRLPQPQIIAEPYVRVVQSPNDWHGPPFVASPSIVGAPDGRLLVAHDLHGAGSGNDTTYVHISEDEGHTWRPLASIQGMFWPSLFRCESGPYLIGVSGQPRLAPNALVISRSDDAGQTWTEPVALTHGLAVHTGNTGALVSRRRVTYSFEVAPTLGPEPRGTRTTTTLDIAEGDLDARTASASVVDTDWMVPHSLVVLDDLTHRLHCRVIDVDHASGRLSLRPERWMPPQGNSYPDSPTNSPGPWHFPAGTPIRVASGTLGNHRDFWAMAIDADASDDLLNPATWRTSNPVGNPAYTHAAVLKDLFGLNFVARDPRGVPDTSGGAMWSGWLEGVLVRLEHPGGSGRIVNLMRMANNVSANLSARLDLDDSGPALRFRFGRFGFDPGLGCTHCALLYDSPSTLYWMASNVNRNSTRDITGLRLTGASAVQERSNLALFYSRNAVDWFMAGLVAYSRDWVHSYHYPHMIVRGSDLLLVARSHIESPLTETTIHSGPDCPNGRRRTADQHNANAITFHRVRDFRSLANRGFICYATG